MKYLKERSVTIQEFEQIPEKRNRIFKVSYVKRNGFMRYEKTYQSKRYVRRYLEDPLVNKVKIFVGDVVDE